MYCFALRLNHMHYFYRVKHWYTYLAAVLFFVSCGNANTQKERADRAVVQAYDMEIPSKMGEAEKRIIRLNEKADTHLLVLGAFNTPVTIVIAEAGPGLAMGKKLLEKHFTEDQEVVININSLKKGIYIMNFTAIAESVVFDFTIE